MLMVFDYKFIRVFLFKERSHVMQLDALTIRLYWNALLTNIRKPYFPFSNSGSQVEGAALRTC